jgi:hypothetical protein
MKAKTKDEVFDFLSDEMMTYEVSDMITYLYHWMSATEYAEFAEFVAAEHRGE